MKYLAVLVKENMMSNNAESWSEIYYPGLRQWEHDANNAWFISMREMLTDDGVLVIPGRGKAFNKKGEEIDETQLSSRIVGGPPDAA